MIYSRIVHRYLACKSNVCRFNEQLLIVFLFDFLFDEFLFLVLIDCV